MFADMSAQELKEMPPFPFPKELFPPGKIPMIPGINHGLITDIFWLIKLSPFLYMIDTNVC